MSDTNEQRIAKLEKLVADMMAREVLQALRLEATLTMIEILAELVDACLGFGMISGAADGWLKAERRHNHAADELREKFPEFVRAIVADAQEEDDGNTGQSS